MNKKLDWFVKFADYQFANVLTSGITADDSWPVLIVRDSKDGCHKFIKKGTPKWDECVKSFIESLEVSLKGWEYVIENNPHTEDGGEYDRKVLAWAKKEYEAKIALLGINANDQETA